MPLSKQEKDAHRDAYKEYKIALKAYRDELERGEWRQLRFNEFLDLVTQKEEIDLDPEKPFCPLCNGNNVKNKGTTQTLVGGCGKFNCNHHWTSLQCLDCNESFTMEWKGHDNALPQGRYNVWYTQKSRVLRGMPTCSENYIYTCRHCGGDVCRKNDNSIRIIGEKNPPTTYFCQQCNQSVESSNEYFQWQTPHKPIKPLRPRRKLRLNWTIQEEKGIAIINEMAIKAVKFE